MNEQIYNKEINDLFEKWIEVQKAETGYNIAEIDISSFTFDGAISPEDYFSAEERILFVCKESNIKKNKKFNNEFWLKNVYEKKTKETLFSQRLSMLANAICNNDFLTVNKAHDILKYVAFLNLNKRGGQSSCDLNVLKNYLSTYKKYISEEIAILNPTIIVCAGSWLKWYLEEEIKLDKKYRIVEAYHPSYYFKSDIEHLKKLDKELKNQP